MSSDPNETNPYQSPTSVAEPTGRRPGEKVYAPCPNCKGVYAKRVGMTLWGGALGPAMLTHVKCSNCGTAYNGKTGKSNSTAIAIYLGVSVVIGAIAGLAIVMMNR